MKKQIGVSRNNEDGFMMIASLLILLVLTLLGIAVNKNTTTEWQIAMNDRLHQEAFYSAEAAAELAAVVAAWGQSCSNEVKIPGIDDGYHAAVIDGESFNDFTSMVTIPSDSNRDIVFPAVFNGTVLDEDATNRQPHANINLGGDTKLTEGSAILMAAGYEGLGKGLGNNFVVIYDIKVQQVGKNGSTSVICAKYPVIGRDSCDNTIYAQSK